MSSGGSIKDRIIRSIWALGELATQKNVRKAVDCTNDVIFEMQIEQLQRRGEIYVAAGGHFTLRDDLADTLLELYPKESSPASAPAAAPGAPASAQEQPAIDPPSTQEPTMKTEKHCPGCDTTKSKDDFDPHQRRCKPCVKEGTGLKGAAAKEAPVPRAKPAAKKKAAAPKGNGVKPAPAAAAPVADELVIPATGAITCRMSGSTAEISQFDALICCTIDQLQILRDWATAQVKRAAA